MDAGNVNAQSLNVSEVAPRLDPNKFELSMFYTQEPDPKLLNYSHIRFLRLPHRLKTLRILREMLSNYDVVAYMDYSPASYLFLHWPKILCRRAKTIMHVE